MKEQDQALAQRSASATYFLLLTCVIDDPVCTCIQQISPHPPLSQVWTSKHVTGLMSSAYSRRPFARSSSLDPVKQYQDRQQKLSHYFASGLPYSRYHRIVDRLAIS